jgi:hypothetical protein
VSVELNLQIGDFYQIQLKLVFKSPSIERVPPLQLRYFTSILVLGSTLMVKILLLLLLIAASTARRIAPGSRKAAVPEPCATCSSVERSLAAAAAATAKDHLVTSLPGLKANTFTSKHYAGHVPVFGEY